MKNVKPASERIPAKLKAAFGTFKVQKKQSSTCIYRKELFWDLEKLEAEIRDEHIGFKGHRICHLVRMPVVAGSGSGTRTNLLPDRLLNAWDWWNT